MNILDLRKLNEKEIDYFHLLDYAALLIFVTERSLYYIVILNYTLSLDHYS